MRGSSARDAEHLSRHGRSFFRIVPVIVYTLDGSIFEWVNEGRPVYRDGRVVAEVHPFDDRWGTLLDRRLWASEF